MEVGIVSLEKLRELRRSIAPLGWEDVFPADEFDSQLMGLVGRLRGGATDLEAQAYLTRIDEELMGPAEAAEASEVHAQLVKSVRNYLEQFPPGRLKFR